MDFKDIRRRVGEAIIGEGLGDNARIRTGFTLVSTTHPDQPGNLSHAKREIDRFWKRDRSNVQRTWLDKFIAELEGEPEKYSRIYALAANHNRLVRDGVHILMFYLTNIATASEPPNGANVGSRPTILQLGSNGTVTHLSTYTGCVTAITAGTLAENVATVTQVTTDSNYPFDTLQLRKTNFNNNAGPDPTVVREIAMRNTDGTKLGFCRTNVSDVPVALTGNLDATYKLQIVP